MFSEGGGVDIFYFLVKDLKKKPEKYTAFNKKNSRCMWFSLAYAMKINYMYYMKISIIEHNNSD